VDADPAFLPALTVCISQVFPGLAEDAACTAARQLKRSALNAALATQRASSAAATTDRFPKRLRTDGRDVVELFVSGPGNPCDATCIGIVAAHQTSRPCPLLVLRLRSQSPQ